MGTAASKENIDLLGENQGVSDTVESIDANASDDVEVNNESKVKEEPKEGKQKEEDTESMDSKDSNDTYVLAWRMPKYLIEKRQRMQRENKLGKDGTAEKSKEQETPDIKQSQEDISNAGDNHKTDVEQNQPAQRSDDTDNKNAIVEPGTDYNDKVDEEQLIDRSQSKGTSDDGNKGNVDTSSHENAAKGNETVISSGSNNPRTKNLEKFEEFKKTYAVKFRRKKSLPNKQTLILTRVGTKFQLVTVPAYLPNQRLYRSSSFVKNYIPDEPLLARRKRVPIHLKDKLKMKMLKKPRNTTIKEEPTKAVTTKAQKVTCLNDSKPDRSIRTATEAPPWSVSIRITGKLEGGGGGGLKSFLWILNPHSESNDCMNHRDEATLMAQQTLTIDQEKHRVESPWPRSRQEKISLKTDLFLS